MKITTIGLDLAKSVFQLHAVDADGTRRLAQEAAAYGASRYAGEASILHGRNGSLRHFASLGAGDFSPGAPGEADAASLCEGISQAPEERCCRCRGDLRGGAPSDNALRAHQERAAAGGARSAPLTRTAGTPAHDVDQRDPRPLCGVWVRCGPGRKRQPRSR